jgi:hypothetical protein
MLTPKLEELIWNGKAAYKTFIAGGSSKCILNIEEDKFIIITDITYFSGNYIQRQRLEDLHKILDHGLNTQVTILGNKGFNRFVFRNNFTLCKASPDDDPTNTQDVNLPIGSTKIDTYLVHTEEVSFSFGKGLNFQSQTVFPSSSDVVAYNQPLDYGRVGLKSLSSIQKMTYTEPITLEQWEFFADGSKNLTPTNANEYNTTEFAYPIEPTTAMTEQHSRFQWATPILHVNYVEIIGNPNNINTR